MLVARETIWEKPECEEAAAGWNELEMRYGLKPKIHNTAHQVLPDHLSNSPSIHHFYL